MNPLVVLDACTILNLLRIDDESDFLIKLIKHWRLCTPETVFNEAKLHVMSDFYPKEKNDHILIVINQEFDYRKTADSDIKKDLTDEEFEKIVKFSGHNKRENGELYCVALALVKSRMEEDTVTLYTDDYKATKAFQDIFRYHCIGQLGDTLDLLTILYWSTPESVFQYTRYHCFLRGLMAEYCHQLNEVFENAQKYLEVQKKLNCKDKDLLTSLGLIVNGYYKSDMDQMEEGIHFFQVGGKKYKDVKRFIGNIDVKNVNMQMKRISEHLKRMNDYRVFKVA